MSLKITAKVRHETITEGLMVGVMWLHILLLKQIILLLLRNSFCYNLIR